MKLKFIRKENGEISLTINNKDFNTDDYLKIIKEVYDGNGIELDNFDDSITEEEQVNIKKMIEKINSIKDVSSINEIEENDDTNIDGKNINSDNIQF